MGQTTAVDRVFLTGATTNLALWPNWSQHTTNPPLGLILVFVGNSSATMKQVAELTVPYDAGNPVNTEVDLRFSPQTGRYLSIQFQTNVTWGVNHWPGYALSSQPPATTNLAWNVGDVEIYGFTGTATNENAVVLPTGASNALALAASELSYYLGELTGKPHPIIAPSATNQYSGTIYRIVDLKPLAPIYNTMTNNIAAGLLPYGVNVQTNGREVVFSAWPYRCVLWSVWEFLEQQGVRWVYPEGHGDFVPGTNGINLGILPLQFAPAARSIYANWDANSLEPWASWMLQSVRQGYLYPWRNRWNFSWNGYGPLGGSEIPAAAAPGGLSTNYTERFSGYPHNLSAVLPNRILLAENSNWWGYDASLGYSVSPGTENITFCMNNPAVINWVANKLIAVDTAYPIPSQWPLCNAHFENAYNLLPLDATHYCQDTNWCIPANGPAVPSGDAWVRVLSNSASGEYYSFALGVASNISYLGSSAMVGALAYADVYEPPVNISAFPSNVQVEVCMYGAPGLAMLSPNNASTKAAWDGWSSKCSRLATYDYTLLHTDMWEPDPRLPVPLVAGIVDHAQYLAQLGALSGGCQVTLPSLPYNPWNFYAYPRIRWNTNQTPSQLLQEFFNAYFAEAAAPMLSYYTAIESYQFTNNVNMHNVPGYCYGITPGSFPLAILASMQSSLQTAESVATNWVTIGRVANVQAGFNWVISQRGLTATNLKDVSGYPVVSTNGAYIINLSSMVAPTNRPQGNFAYWNTAGYWQYLAQGTIQTTLNFAQAGTYQVVVTALGNLNMGAYPSLNVYLGPNMLSASINSSTYTNYTFSFPVQPGVWDLVLDYNTAPLNGNRYIDIDQIQVLPQ
jgi:hypothetical protein